MARRPKMRAAVLVGLQRVELEQVPIPTPAPDEVPLRLEGWGLCALGRCGDAFTALVERPEGFMKGLVLP